MRIDVLSLFPDFFNEFLEFSIIKRARLDHKVEIKIHNIRDYSNYNNKQVDDYAYGGGAGMVLMIEPIYNALETLKRPNSLIIMLTPQGKVYNQNTALNLSKENHIILLCGHYEGFDERIRSLVDIEISIGDYILTGGETAALIIMDSIIRLLPGVIKEESHQNDSFTNNLLDYPVYTKPTNFNDMKVPEVLLSGHHLKIKEWRAAESLKKTKLRRSDLLKGR